MKIIILILTLCIGCSLANAESLIIGTTPNSPPLASSSDSGGKHFLGFEIDIMNAICQRINAQCQYKSMIVSNIATELSSTNMNLAIAAIIIPSEKSDTFTFSIPYLPSNARFMTNNQSTINSPLDIKNKRVGVRKGTLFGGTLFEKIALNIYNQQIKVTEYADMNDLLDGLQNNNVDVVFSNAATIDYWALNNENSFKLIGAKIPVGNGYGIMAKANEGALIARINKALLSMQADGSYLSIYSRYFN